MNDVEPAWASDSVALALHETLGIEYVALNPGASFRGLHDSLVALGNPTMLVCLHEEHAIAIAHGYAKVLERPMAAILHSNVGLMHGSMAIYNAWCDRAPVVILGATGPVDAAQRRPWIDWIHTSADQAALVRPFTKWDDQPASLAAALASLARADQVARTEPCGPTYVCLDAALQESRAPLVVRAPNALRHAPPQRSAPSASDLAKLAATLRAAERPVMLVGRVSRDPRAWDDRVRLAERLGAAVITDLKLAAGFPTRHPAHVGIPGYFLDDAAKEALRQADVVLSLDAVDLAGVLQQAYGTAEPGASIVSISLDRYALRGWNMDCGGLAPVDLDIAAHPDVVIPLVLEALPGAAVPRWRNGHVPSPSSEPRAKGAIGMADLGSALSAELSERAFTLTRVPLGWSGDLIPFSDPLTYLGYDGGAGIGSGPGMAVGSALALRAGGRLPVAVLGDGDFLMGCTAVWTAVNQRIPLLVVIANNRAYYNDVVHQERMARERGRPLQNKWVGQRIDDPPVDLLAMARAQGAMTFDRVEDVADLRATLARAITATAGGETCVVDVAIEAEYAAAMTAALSRELVHDGMLTR